MPNTPMQIGEGCTVYSPGRYVTTQDLEKVDLILNSLGIAQQVPEKMIDPIGALAGSGPAYVRTILLTIGAAFRADVLALLFTDLHGHRSIG